MSEYKNKVKNIYQLISNNCFENSYLEQLRDTLLPKLMSGEIDVSKVNISADKLSFTEEQKMNWADCINIFLSASVLILTFAMFKLNKTMTKIAEDDKKEKTMTTWHCTALISEPIIQTVPVNNKGVCFQFAKENGSSFPIAAFLIKTRVLYSNECL